ncbi:putative Glucose-methanol-choline oxidoreductase N-terminal domain-containing protein [Seiridium cardinale]|uniref:Glucose-methanol-choline oxidoreductase N-terminal domain-containing protein n=1 Tax=Seiridium cardinale TaxID=138064 RepID=A0ABR2XEM6_9PEZI
MHFKLMGSAALAGFARMAAAASATTAYTDPNTGIDFQQYTDSDSGFSFGMAVPENPTTDFIGQMVVPLTDSAGWGAIALGPGMTGRLLLVAWPNGDEVVSSFRYTSAYSNPDVYTNTTLSALPIANGTFVNSTHMTYTFVCETCVIGGSTTFDFSDGTGALGFAVSSSNPTTPSDSSSALVYHDVGANIYVANFTAAESAQYETWASWASAVSATPTTGGSNSTNSTTPSTGSGSNSTLSTPTTLNTTYDVIVVGGGTAGIIAAERLAEGGSSVLLIERGPANTVALGSSQGLSWNTSLTPYDVPALGSSLSTLSGTKFCSDTASTAGCLLGGSSSVNGLNFIRPAAHDFENWPTGWDWDSISEAADRLYTRNPGTTQPSADGQYYNDLAFTTWSAYLGKQGWNEVDSIESPNEKQAVFSRPAWSISDHLRAGPARTYMPFAQQLDTFTLKLETNVIQVLRTGSTVTGVLTQADDGTTQIINVNTNGKVVLAAGALSTPRVLWNSGIGRSDALEIVQSGTSGVSLPASSDWIDLPVGHNLMDHAQVPLQFAANPTFTAFDFKGLAASPEETDLDLYEEGSGTITQAAQRMHLWTSINGTDGVTRYLQGTVSSMADDTITVKAFLTHGSTSRGELGISASGSTILNTKPWLQTDEDMAVYSEFIQFFLDMVASNSSAAGNSSCTLSYSTSGATPSSIISSSLVSGDHWVGSTRMGTDDGRENGTAVVDTNTKVYGTDNLFVVDASIHPDLPTGNTQAIIMVAAEQAAAKIAAYDVTNWNGSGNSTTTTPVTTGGNTSGGSKCRKRKRSTRQQVNWHS